MAQELKSTQEMARRGPLDVSTPDSPSTVHIPFVDTSEPNSPIQVSTLGPHGNSLAINGNFMASNANGHLVINGQSNTQIHPSSKPDESGDHLNITSS